MNEMDLLARFRAQAPSTEVSPKAEHRFQSALQLTERERDARPAPAPSLSRVPAKGLPG